MVQVQASADHPVALGNQFDIAQFGLDPVCRWAIPVVGDKTAACQRLGDKASDDESAVFLVGEVPQALAYKAQLARMHDIDPVELVDKEVVVVGLLAKVHQPQQRTTLFAGIGIGLGLGTKMRQNLATGLYKVLDLVLAGLHQHGFQSRKLRFLQAMGLVTHHPTHCDSDQDQHQHGQ